MLFIRVSCSQCPVIYGYIARGSKNELAGPLPAIKHLFCLSFSSTPKAGSQKCLDATELFHSTYCKIDPATM